MLKIQAVDQSGQRGSLETNCGQALGEAGGDWGRGLWRFLLESPG